MTIKCTYRTKVVKIMDKNQFAEAAAKEYAKLNPEQKAYVLGFMNCALMGKGEQEEKEKVG